MTSTIALRHVAFEDLGMLDPLLRERGHEVSYREAGVDVLGDELVRAELLVVLGGPIGVYETDAYPFLLTELEVIARRLAAGRPTLGLCLGAQLIARALGAQVAPTGRTEIGYAPLTLVVDSVLEPLRDVPVLHWHGDQFEIPAGARRLAETPGFPNQAFELPGVLALQFHPEVEPRGLERWLIGHASELSAAGIHPRTLREQGAAASLAGPAAAMFGAWLDGVGL